MNISPETKKISEIFSIESKTIYKIPLYQRNYSWQIKQIESLIEDISNEERGYYIGNLLVNQSNDPVFGSKIFEIVDGQQRLTTIALIYIGIYDILNNFKNEQSKDVFPIQYDIKRKLFLEESIDNPKYLLLQDDREIYLSIASSIIFEKEGKKVRKRSFFKRFDELKSKLLDLLQNLDEVKTFYSKLNDVEILQISVNNLSDAYSVFSALNSKGLPLTLVDLLKNEYLKQANYENRNQDDAIKGWYNLVEQFADDEDINVSDVTQFLLNNYDSFESLETASITKGKALDRYNKLIKDKRSTYLTTLSERARKFVFLKKGYGISSYSEQIVNRVNDLNYLDPSQSYPLLMLLFVNTSLDLDETILVKILEVVIKFFVIRNVTLRPKASNVRSMFLGINRRILKNNLKGVSILEDISNTIHKEVDNNAEFKNQLINEGIFDKNHSTTRFLLIKLERTFGNFFNKSNPDTLEELNGKKPRWTIEHILPQGRNLTDYWRNVLSPNNPSIAENIQEEQMHKLGNLTLTPYNSELGQKTFKEKVNQIDNENSVGLKLKLFLNKSILNDQLDENWDTKDLWSVDDINRRTEILANYLIEIFGIKD
jgi:uncharacterized protein with ParB-like and HNH nuclease domain